MRRQHRLQRGPHRRTLRAERDPLAFQVAHAAQFGVVAHDDMHHFGIKAAQRAQAGERPLRRERAAALVRQFGGVGLGQPDHGVAAAQQGDVFGAAAGDQRRDADLARLAHRAQRPGEGEVLAAVWAAGQRIALLHARQPAVDAGDGALQFLLHHVLRRAGGAVGDRMSDLVQRFEQPLRHGRRRAGIE